MKHWLQSENKGELTERAWAHGVQVMNEGPEYIADADDPGGDMEKQLEWVP